MVFQGLCIISQGKDMQPYDYQRTALHAGNSGTPLRDRHRTPVPASCILDRFICAKHMSLVVFLHSARVRSACRSRPGLRFCDLK